MNCNRIDEFLDRGSAGKRTELPREILEHLDECERCRRLWELFDERPARLEVPVSLSAKIVHDLTQSLQPVSPVRPAGAIALMLIGGFFLLSFGLTSMMGASAMQVMSLSQMCAVGALIGAGAVVLAVSISHQIIPGSSHPIAPKVAILSFLVGVVLSNALLFPWHHTDRFIFNGLRCSSGILMVAVPAAAMAWGITRRGVALAPDLLGASIGLFAGLAGALVLQLNCLVLEAKHVLVWHIGMVIAATAAGFLLGRYRDLGRKILRLAPIRQS